jgi:hypothetical protein
MSKNSEIVPKFNSEAEEREFWEVNNSSDFVDWKRAEPVLLPNLKPSTRTISLRLSDSFVKLHPKVTHLLH